MYKNIYSFVFANEKLWFNFVNKDKSGRKQLEDDINIILFSSLNKILHLIDK